jgi:hypothetical protein
MEMRKRVLRSRLRSKNLVRESSQNFPARYGIRHLGRSAVRVGVSGSGTKWEGSMRFVLVNHRLLPKHAAFCAWCCEAIDETYVRELHTRLIYCCAAHYYGHVSNAAETVTKAAS